MSVTIREYALIGFWSLYCSVCGLRTTFYNEQTAVAEKKRHAASCPGPRAKS